MLANHHRYAFSPITKRPDFDWPDGRRLAVYLGMNLECFAFGEGLGAELAPGGPQPDVLNFAWRDYGNRVGVWRMLELFDDLALPTTALVNSRMYAEAPGVVEAFRARGDEIAGHGRTNAERQGVLDEAGERSLIEEATAEIERQEGRRPRGWLGPWISQSAVTPDLLQEAGYAYLLDWCHDDQPIWMKTRQGRILAVPYPQELNDIPQIVARRREGADFADMIVDAFDVMLEESRRRPLVMGIALHAYLMGHPHRLKHLARALRTIKDRANERVWFTTAGAISDHFAEIAP
ncbi:MAG: polysaccharide deacetylase family protein [Pseudomonadota bacterium]